MSSLSEQTSATTTAEKPVDGHASTTDTNDQIKREDTDQVTPVTPQERAGDSDLEELLCKIQKLDVGGEYNSDTPEEEPRSQTLPSRGPGPIYWPYPPPQSKGFILESLHANMLLLNQVFFIVFPNVYVFDKHRIVCCIDHGNRYLQVDSLKPNPPEPESIFYLENMPYWFDPHNQLWYNLDGQWYPETTYSDLPSARVELARCAERNRLAAPVSNASTRVASTISDATNSPRRESPSSEDEYLYPPLGASPGRVQIDAWFEEFKSRRTALQKTRERVPEIRCPINECRKTQRRPQALRDHLYFHFGIKPYKCDFGCPIAFETEANKNRHLDSCAYRRYGAK
ncbi:hypothetical protein FS749_005824 [Ceratobasidium sp. UAMH 11750]|nr:hypothetical protein FS749_005824 [Ceratobasidium sp. UAMH 11750]